MDRTRNTHGLHECLDASSCTGVRLNVKIEYMQYVRVQWAMFRDGARVCMYLRVKVPSPRGPISTLTVAASQITVGRGLRHGGRMRPEEPRPRRFGLPERSPCRTLVVVPSGMVCQQVFGRRIPGDAGRTTTNVLAAGPVPVHKFSRTTTVIARFAPRYLTPPFARWPTQQSPVGARPINV